MSKLRSHALEQCGNMPEVWSANAIATTNAERAAKGMGSFLVTDYQDQGLVVAAQKAM